LSLDDVEAYAASVREEVILGRDYDAGSCDTSYVTCSHNTITERTPHVNTEEEISADGTPLHSVITEVTHILRFPTLCF
jgi:hypothetical protein